jgi:hypothetical protein
MQASRMPAREMEITNPTGFIDSPPDLLVGIKFKNLKV